MTFKRAFFTVGGWTLVSRFTGFIRDVVAANILGAGMAADAFFIALRLPNLFRRLFAEGAFTISFVPLFTGTLKEGTAEARHFAEEALSVLVATLLVFTLVMMMGMPLLMHVITPGYADEPEKFALAVNLSQITFPYLLLVSLAALLGSILNALGRFGPYAASPTAFNLVQIGALWVCNQNEIVAATGQAWAITISGAVQLLWLALSLRRAGWGLTLRWPAFTPRIKRLLQLIGPGALGAGAMQINIFIDMVLASLLPAGAISFLSYADRLYQLPIGVIGIAMGTALLPILSHVLREEGNLAALKEQNRALEFSLYLGVPSAVGIGLIPVLIIQTLYQGGAFTADATASTALAVSAFALAIPAYMISKVLTAAFYAREDTKTPFSISLKTIVINSCVSFSAVTLMMKTGHGAIAHVGIALATATTAWLNTFLLARALHRRSCLLIDAQLKQTIGRILLCALAMAVLLLLGREALSVYWPAESQVALQGSVRTFFAEVGLPHLLALPLLFTLRVLPLAVLGSVAAVFYLGLAHVSGAQRLDEALQMLRRRRVPKGAGIEPPVE